MEKIISNVKKRIETSVSASLFVMGICCLAPAYAGGTPSAGSLDVTFNIDGIVTTDLGYVIDVASATAIQSDGKIVAAGFKNAYVPPHAVGQTPVPWAADFALARYNTDGSLDTSFGTGGKVFTDLGSTEDYIRDIAIQSDGKIVVAGATAIMYCYTAGTATHCYPLSRIAVARYNTNGSLDISFGNKGIVITSIGDASRANAISLQTDGRIVVGGASGLSADYSFDDYTIVRYNSNGTLDSSFGVNGVVVTNLSNYIGNISSFRHDVISDLAMQADGKIVAAGWATVDLPLPNGGYKDNFAVVRYNANGTLDSSFNSNGIVTTAFSGTYVYDQASSVAIQSDGKIVLGGVAGTPLSSNEYNNTFSTFALARYNTNGSLDSTFGSGGKTTTAVGVAGATGQAMKLQSDGKIVVTGTAFDNVRVSGVVGTYPHFATARYNTSGTLDRSFGSQGKVLTFVGPIGGYASTLAIQADNKLVAVGANIIPYNNYTGKDFALLRYNP